MPQFTKATKMLNSELKKSKIYNIAEIRSLGTDKITIQPILKKPTGVVNFIGVQKGEEIKVKLSRFDQFVQIIEGEALVEIDAVEFQLITGQCLIIPANSKNRISAKEDFKMISTIIKSGYE